MNAQDAVDTAERNIRTIRPRDDKGRLEVGGMSDRELMEEMVVSFRMIADTLQELGESPMIRAMGINNPFGQ